MKTFDSGYAFIIGIANYAHVPQLPSTILKDATDLGTLLTDRDYCGYRPAQVQHLLHLRVSPAHGVAHHDEVRILRNLFRPVAIAETDALFLEETGHGGVDGRIAPFDVVPQIFQSGRHRSHGGPADSHEIEALPRSHLILSH